MANKFSDIDLIRFHDEAPNTLNLNSIKAHFISHEGWDSDKVGESMRKAVVSHSYFMGSEYRAFLREAYHLIFLVKLESMPLLINRYTNNEDLDFIVKWRLKVG